MIGRLGLHLSLRSGREALVRLLLTALAVTIGVTILLGIFADYHAFQVTSRRPAWEKTQEAASDVPASREALWNYSESIYKGRFIEQLDVAALGPGAPVVPGIPGLPDSGQYYASPALSALLRTAPHDELGARFPGTQAGIIGDKALSGPDELAIIVGYSPTTLAALPNTMRIDRIAAGIPLFVVPVLTDAQKPSPGPVFIGLFLIMVGLVTGGSWLTMQAARMVPKIGRGASTLLASRRLADNPRLALRAASGLVLAVFAGTMIACLVPALHAAGTNGNTAELTDVLRVPYTGGAIGNGLSPQAGDKLLRDLHNYPGTTVIPIYVSGQAEAKPGRRRLVVRQSGRRRPVGVSSSAPASPTCASWGHARPASPPSRPTSTTSSLPTTPSSSAKVCRPSRRAANRSRATPPASASEHF